MPKLFFRMPLIRLPLNGRPIVCTLLVIVATIGSAPSAHADWRQFRGPEANGHGEEIDLPVEWSIEDKKNIAWTAKLPGRGPSGPIVVGDRVFVTSSSGNKQDTLHILAFDLTSGKQLWERQFWSTGRTSCHPSSANAAPTPTSDGKRVFAFFSSCDLVCLDLDGNLEWFRGLALDYPKAGNDVGMSSSPVVADDVVVVQVECQGDSFVAGIDRSSGMTSWVRKREQSANWASPTVLRDSDTGEELVFLQSKSGVSAHNPATGSRVWEKKIQCDMISSSSPNGGTILVPSGGITAFRKKEGSNEPEIIWRENRLMPGAASPVAHNGFVYTLNRAGVLKCGDMATGEIRWPLRLKGAFWATPVAIADRLYAANDAGVVFVVSLGEKGKVVSRNEFGEKIQASPAVSDNAMFYRSDSHLWKIATNPE